MLFGKLEISGPQARGADVDLFLTWVIANPHWAVPGPAALGPLCRTRRPLYPVQTSREAPEEASHDLGLEANVARLLDHDLM